MYRMLFVMAALSGMVACSSSAPVSDTSSANAPDTVLANNLTPNEDMVCTREKKTGSNMLVRRCVTKEQAEKEVQKAKGTCSNTT